MLSVITTAARCDFDDPLLVDIFAALARQIRDDPVQRSRFFAQKTFEILMPRGRFRHSVRRTLNLGEHLRVRHLRLFELRNLVVKVVSCFIFDLLHQPLGESHRGQGNNFRHRLVQVANTIVVVSLHLIEPGLKRSQNAMLISQLGNLNEPRHVFQRESRRQSRRTQVLRAVSVLTHEPVGVHASIFEVVADPLPLVQLSRD